MVVGKIFKEAIGSLFKKPATVLYPVDKLTIPPGFRGAPEVNETTCIGCKICAKECPARAIEMVDVGVKNPRPAFYYGNCIFCAVCSDVCPKKAITLTSSFELASTDPKTFVKMPNKPVSPEIGADKVADQKE